MVAIKRIGIYDGQGGGIGKVLTEKIRKSFGDSVEIWVFGTNATATALMLKAGADDGATGENAIVTSVNQVDVIVSTLSFVLANSLLGEVTPPIAEAIASARVPKLLLPLNRASVTLVGVKPEPLPHLVAETIKALNLLLDSGER